MKFKLFTPYSSEFVVFVKVNKDILKVVSKLRSSKIKTPDNINKLIKKDINIRKEIFI